MQPSNRGLRIKLNRNAFKLDEDSVPRRRRRFSSSGSECTDPVVKVHATRPSGQEEPLRVTVRNEGTPTADTLNEEPSRALFTLGDCSNNNNNNNNNINASRRKQIRCHLHLALRFCGGETFTKHREAEQSVSCTVSRYRNGDVRVETSTSTGDAIETCAGSVTPQGVDVTRVKMEKDSLGVPEKKDGRAAPRRPNFNQNAGLRKLFGSISRLGQGRQVKRSVKIACCALCGDAKYTPPACKQVAHAHKTRSRPPSQTSRPEQTMVLPVAQTKMTARLIIWFRRHLKVKLCDIAHVFDVTSRDFSCVLPAMMLQKSKHKRVKCFSKEFGSLVRLDHQGSGSCGKLIGKEFWEVCTPTNSCASLSSGNQVLGFSVGERILDAAEDVEALSESSDIQVLRMPNCEVMRESSVEENACMPVKHGEIHRCIETASYGGSRVVSEVQEVKVDTVHRVPPLLLRRVRACNSFASCQHLKHVDVADCFTLGEADTNNNCLVDNGLNDGSEGDGNSPDCFSCQRTTAYMVQPRLSCARTDRYWPFPRRGPPCEMKASIHIGPRWIMTTEASEGTQNVRNAQTSSEYTFEKSTTESLVRFNTHNESVVSLIFQGQVQSKTQNHTEDCTQTLKWNSKDQSESNKHGGQASTSVNSEGEYFKHSHSVFQQDPSCLGSVHENNSETVDIRSPEAMIMNYDNLNVIPTEIISAVDKNAVDRGHPSMNRTQRSNPSECLRESENGTNATDSLSELQLNSFHYSSCTVHSREESQTHTVVVPTNMEPKLISSVMVHPKEGQKNDTDIKNHSHCSLKVLHTKTADHNTSSPTCTPVIINRSSFSTPEEEINLSPAKIPQEGDEKRLLLQYDACEAGKTDVSPSLLPAPEVSVVTDGELDVVQAYKDDAIVLDVIHDDPDLFGAIVMSTKGNSASKTNTDAVQRAKNMCMQTGQTTLGRKPRRIVWDLKSERRNVQDAGDVRVENHGAFSLGAVTQPAKNSKNELTSGTVCHIVNPVVDKGQVFPDCNNNVEKKENTGLNFNKLNPGLTRLVDDAHNNVSTAARRGINIARPTSSYCWYYFSEHHSCFRNTCWYLHVPKDDDEKFCMDVVQKFCCDGNPSVVQRAVAIFVAYYRTNSPGMSFCQNVVNQLLSSLLSLALLRDLVSVINTLLTHKRTPPAEIVIALYQHVQENGILSFVPELIYLTSKIAEVGCVLSVEQCEMMQLHLESLHIPRHQMDIFSAVKCRALATNPHTAGMSEMAQSIVRVELCKNQEDWPALARVFCTACGGCHSAGELSRFCCCVTMALLKEPKDRLTLPYEPFADSVCQEVPSDEMVKSFLGQVGVSLMFSYHRTQDWTKGLKLVCVMSRLHLEFTMLKGLFSSETGTSRCQLITIAAEFFIQSGSIEGALNLLKGKEWFVSSSEWPCEQADIQDRKRVLILLAEKTSYRDTLEVLTNLPGLRQPVGGVEVSEYNTMFNAHLRRCMLNQVLPVAADTLEFMLTQEIPLDSSELQHLIHKLGKQNNWSRARSLFKRAHSAGYYSGVVYTKDSLALPCCLTEIEMTLVFEMFITCTCTSVQNPGESSKPLLITLKRPSANGVVMESVYLAAGCRLLSAALIPNPKLIIRYTAVNQEQEQLFSLDSGSAAKWVSRNHSWAQAMWASSHTLTQTKTAFQQF